MTESNVITVVMVERSIGSFSMVHMSASASLIRSSKRISSAIGLLVQLGRVDATSRSADPPQSPDQ